MPDIMPWHLTQLLNPDYSRVDLVKEGANSQANIKLFKSKGGAQMKFADVIAKLKPEHASVIVAHIEEITKAKDDTIEEITKAKNDAEAALETANIEKGVKDEDDMEVVLKSIKDPAVRKIMETQIAKTAAAEAEVRKAREAAVTAEAIAKAKELEGIGSDNDTLVELYKSLGDKPELRDNVFGVLKAAKEVAASGSITTEIGKSATNATGMSEEEAWGKIEAAADEIMKSRGIKKGAAVNAIIEEQPELYQAYINAQEGR